VAISHLEDYMAAIRTKTSTKTVHRNTVGAKSRLNFRLAPEIKTRISRAAALTGCDLTEFAVAALNEKADEVIERHDHFLLDSDQYRFFLDALSDKEATKPSAHSAEAAERYRRGKRKGVRYHIAD